MPTIQQYIQYAVSDAVQELYQAEVTADSVNLTPTRKEFEGDYTVVVFPYTRAARKKPEAIAEELGSYLVGSVDAVSSYNVVKGFLNLTVAPSYWTSLVGDILAEPDYGIQPSSGRTVMVEYSSPNTNKPLHLGHVRNILLGESTSRILTAVGHRVIRTQIINDRGIAICKSMYAWERFGEGSTPESTGIKGDHFVGKHYVMFEHAFREEYELWQQSEVADTVYQERKREDETKAAFYKRYKNDYFNEVSEMGRATKDLLLRWEDNDEEVRDLWSKMNGWVYSGFDKTYERLEVKFDTLYYESDTYLLGKELVQQGLEQGVFYQKEDGSVWCDLTDVGLDEKIVLRSDGTSVYMTQDLGTAQQRYTDHGIDSMVYVVATEQDYHFKVLFEILKKLGEPYADGLYHLSYGLVNLPEGRMKTREGTVVDADDLIAEVVAEAAKNADERGELQHLSEAQKQDTYRQIGLAALKFFILRVGAKKEMIFNPKESVDFQGQTGPYVQNACVRVQSVVRKAEAAGVSIDAEAAARYSDLQPEEQQLIMILNGYPETVEIAATQYDPSVVASFAYQLARAYHKFYSEHIILQADAPAATAFRLQLSQATLRTLRHSLHLLGIDVPERM